MKHKDDSVEVRPAFIAWAFGFLALIAATVWWLNRKDATGLQVKAINICETVLNNKELKAALDSAFVEDTVSQTRAAGIMATWKGSGFDFEGMIMYDKSVLIKEASGWVKIPSQPEYDGPQQTESVFKEAYTPSEKELATIARLAAAPPTGCRFELQDGGEFGSSKVIYLLLRQREQGPVVFQGAFFRQ